MRFQLMTGRFVQRMGDGSNKVHQATGPHPPVYVEADIDLEKMFGVEKFRRVGGGNPNPNAHVWDSSRESLESFVNRMQGANPIQAAAEAGYHGQPLPDTELPPAGEEPPAADSQEDLTRLSVRQLQALAEREGIDLDGATRKDMIIQTIRSARAELEEVSG